MHNWFGRWKDRMISILTSLVVVAKVLILVGCYTIPCVQELIQWLIETVFTKQSPPPYKNNLFLLEIQKHESQQLLNEFEENNLN
jgi:predicted PurR-regulated permease PerM